MDRHPARFAPGTRVVVIHPVSVHHAQVGTVTRGDDGRALVRFGTSQRAISFPNAQLCATTR